LELGPKELDWELKGGEGAETETEGPKEIKEGEEEEEESGTSGGHKRERKAGTDA
jgi:hypothetical protein